MLLEDDGDDEKNLPLLYESQSQRAVAAAHALDVESETTLDEDEDAVIEKEKLEKYGVDRVFFQRLWLLTTNGLWQQYWKLFILFIVACASQIMKLLVGLMIANFLQTLSQKTGNAPFDFLVIVAVMVLVAVCASITRILSEYIAASWRERLTAKLQFGLCKGSNAYRLVNAPDSNASETDNIDERIQESVRLAVTNFCYNLFGQFGPSIAGNDGLLSVVILLVMSFAALFSETSSDSNGLAGPLCGLALSFLSGILGVFAIMRPIARLVIRQNRLEAEFRRDHARNKMFAESIAFYQGEEQEFQTAETDFQAVVRNSKLLLTKTAWFSLYNSLNVNFIGILVPYFFVILFYALLGDEYLGVNPDSKTITNDRITRFSVLANIFLQALVAGVNVVVNLNSFGPLIGDTHRVGGLLQTMATLEPDDEDEEFGHHQNDSLDHANARMLHHDEYKGEHKGQQMMMQFTNSHIRCENVSIVTPTGQTLMRNISFTVTPGDSLVVVGPSGAGKTSILRVIAGLWKAGEGHVERPGRIGFEGIYFLPQRPYISNGSLRAQITYPDVPGASDEAERTDQRAVNDEELTLLLKAVGLEYLAETYGVDESHNWLNILSGGEQQRLGFCRLFYHLPRFVIMDESTSALDPETEALVMHACKNAGITMLSIAHRKSVVGFHQRILALKKKPETGDIVYSISPVTEQEYPVLPAVLANDDSFAENKTEQSITKSLDPSLDEAVAHMRRARERYENTEVYSEVPPLVEVPLFVRKNLGGITATNDKNSPQGMGGVVRRRFWFLWAFTFHGCCSRHVRTIWWVTFVAFSKGVLMVSVFICVPLMLDAVSNYDVPGMFTSLGAAATLLIGVCLLDGYIYYKLSLAMLQWRIDLVAALQVRLFQPRIWYDACNRDKRIADLDQRTTADIQKMTQLMIDLLSAFALVPTGLLFFLNAINIAPLTALAGLAYGIVVLFSGFFLLRRVPRAVFAREIQEGEFRYLLIRVRTFCESIAFYKGGDRELTDLANKLHELMEAIYSWIPKYTFGMSGITLLNVMVNAVVLGAMLGRLILANYEPDEYDIPTLTGEMQSVVNFSFAFISFTSVVLGQFSNVAGLVNRIAETFAFVEELELRQQQESDSTLSPSEQQALEENVKQIELHDVAVSVPISNVVSPFGDRMLRTLFHGLSLTIKPGQPTIIQGKSGCGKSTLLRVISKLWPVQQGTVICPSAVGRGGTLFVPQSPYLPEGSLAAQIAYPHTVENMTQHAAQHDTSVMAICESLMSIVGLTHVLTQHGLTEVLPWGDILSVGEQQRLAFCRVFFHRPLFAVLDEATSALDLDSQRICMTQLVKFGITAVSVAHRVTLLDFHSQRLTLFPPKNDMTVGSFKVEQLDNSAAFEVSM